MNPRLSLIVLLMLITILAASNSLAASLQSCVCEIVRNPITVVNPADSSATFTIRQSGAAASWSTLTETELTLGPKEYRIVDSFIKPDCNAQGIFSLTTVVVGAGSKGSINQEIIVNACQNTTGNVSAPPPGGLAPNQGWILALAGTLLLLLLVLIAAYLLLEKDQGYYRRIRLGEPKITPISGRGKTNAWAWILAVVLLIVLIFFIWLLVHYLVGVIGAANPATNQSASNSSSPNLTSNASSNLTVNIVQNSTNNSSSSNATSITLGEMFKSFISTYWPYLVFGFAVLVILVMLSPKKDSE